MDSHNDILPFLLWQNHKRKGRPQSLHSIPSQRTTYTGSLVLWHTQLTPAPAPGATRDVWHMTTDETNLLKALEMSIAFALQKLSHSVLFSQFLPRPFNNCLLPFHTAFLLLQQAFGRCPGNHWQISAPTGVWTPIHTRDSASSVRLSTPYFPRKAEPHSAHYPHPLPETVLGCTEH